MKNLTYYQKSILKHRVRQQQLRKKFYFCIFSILIPLFILFVITSFSTQASDLDHKIAYKYYKSIEITSGDTLWSIAEKFKDDHYVSTFSYVNEIKAINSLTSNVIRSGDYIIVPYYSTEFK